MPKILIVDDEAHIRRLLKQSLEDLKEAGCELIVAENGRIALEMLQKHSPNLVFLDIMMPEMNGYDVCETIKKQLKLNDVYVIMLTARGQEIDREKGFSCGADEYMTKPFDPDEIVQKSFEILKLKKNIFS